MRLKLLRLSLLSKEHKIRDENGCLLLPISGEVSMGYPVVEREMERVELPLRSLMDVLDLPEELKDEIPSSYEIVGDIAVIKVPEALEGYGRELGEALLRVHNSVKVALEDIGVEGDLRVRQVVHLAGEERTRTVHREHGAEFVVDLSKAYFSPRLATERWRVVQQVSPGEQVLDMFAGVGPYSILIARNTEVQKVYAVDLNPEAVVLLRENVRRNKVEDVVETIQGDARDVDLKVDRVIMNLPHSARDFFTVALSCIKPDGGFIHYYEMINDDGTGSMTEELKCVAGERGYNIEVLDIREVRTYSATKIHVGVDMRIIPKY